MLTTAGATRFTTGAKDSWISVSLDGTALSWAAAGWAKTSAAASARPRPGTAGRHRFKQAWRKRTLSEIWETSVVNGSPFRVGISTLAGTGARRSHRPGFG